MKTLKLTALGLFLSLNAFSQTTWTIDKSHSKVAFTTTHLMVSEVDGRFKEFEGKAVTTKGDDFANATIDLTVDAKSINTEDEKRDQHLRSADFFDTEKFPTVTFKSSSFKKVNANLYQLTGDLTMHGVTKKVTLDAKPSAVIKDPWGKTRTGFRLSGIVKRSDYGISWNSTMDAGGLVVSDEVNLNIGVELIKQ